MCASRVYDIHTEMKSPTHFPEIISSLKHNMTKASSDSKKWQVQWWLSGAGRTEGWGCLRRTEVLFGNIKKSWRWMLVTLHKSVNITDCIPSRIYNTSDVALPSAPWMNGHLKSTVLRSMPCIYLYLIYVYIYIKFKSKLCLLRRAEKVCSRTQSYLIRKRLHQEIIRSSPNLFLMKKSSFKGIQYNDRVLV